MNTHRYAFCAAFALVGTSIVVQAADDKKQQEMPPSASNPQRDGRTSDPSMNNDFTTYDGDNDGSLSSTEFGKANLQGATIAQLDKNSDGKVSRDEWNTYQKTHSSGQNDRR